MLPIVKVTIKIRIFFSSGFENIENTKHDWPNTQDFLLEHYSLVYSIFLFSQTQRTQFMNYIEIEQHTNEVAQYKNETKMLLYFYVIVKMSTMLLIITKNSISPILCN